MRDGGVHERVTQSFPAICRAHKDADDIHFVATLYPIFPEDAVPDEWKHFTESNAAFYRT